MNYKSLLYFDIETCGNYKNLEEFKFNDQRGYALFEKKYLRNKGNFDWNLPIDDAYIKKASLLPEYGKIICITVGKLYNGKFESISYLGKELEILTRFHNILKKANDKQMSLCGFNIKSFDIPWINKKLYQYGFSVPYIISTLNKKPWEHSSIDLCESWKSNGYDFSSLDEVAYALNIESPKKIMSGENVHNYFYNGKLNIISEYCKMDVKTSYLIAEKILK